MWEGGECVDGRLRSNSAQCLTELKDANGIENFTEHQEATNGLRASWLALPGNAHRNAARVFADSSSPSASLAKPDRTTQARWSETYGKLSRSFEANQGQFDSRVKFVSRGAGQTLYLTATPAVFFVHSGREPSRNQESALSHDAPGQQQTKTASAKQAVIRMRLVGANANASNPHYCPTEQSCSPIRRGDLLLLDL